MNILGISAYYHDSAACLVRDGEVIGAAQEERFSRKKHDAGFPRHAIQFCLDEAGVRLDQLDGGVKAMALDQYWYPKMNWYRYQSADSGLS